LLEPFAAIPLSAKSATQDLCESTTDGSNPDDKT
jgi:hypothetical protein